LDEHVLAKTVAALGRAKAQTSAQSLGDVADQARRYMSTIARHTTAKLEIGDVMACFLILHRSCAFTNTRFQTVLLTQFLTFVNNYLDPTKPPLACRLQKSGDQWISVSQVFDYLYRPVELHSMSLLEFLLVYEKRSNARLKKKKKRRNTNSTRGTSSDQEVDNDNGNTEDSIECDADVVHDLAVLKFLPEHPESSTTHLAKRKATLLADIIGPRMPDAEDESCSEEYAMQAILLFQPWTSADHFRVDDTNPEPLSVRFAEMKRRGFEGWYPKTEFMLDNMQAYHFSKKMADKVNAERRDAGEFDDDSSDSGSENNDPQSNNNPDTGHSNEDEFDPDSYDQAIEHATNLNSICEQVGNVVAAACSDCGPTSAVGLFADKTQYFDTMVRASRQSAIRVTCQTGENREIRDQALNMLWPQRIESNSATHGFEYRIVAPRRNSTLQNDVDYDITDVNSLMGSNLFSKSDSKSYVRQLQNAVSESRSAAVALCSAPVATSVTSTSFDQVRVIEIKDASQEFVRRDPTSDELALHDEFISNHVLPSKCSIAKASAICNFNEEQHQAFCIMAKALLDAFAADIDGTVLDAKNNLRLLLMGSGGCGKSHVISGVAAFAAAWGRPDAVVLTATTGAAAKNIRNCTTIDSKLKMQRDRTESNQQQKFSHDEQLQWQRVKLLFCDECSMINLKMLQLISARMSDATGYPGSFGNVPAVVFCGDYHQMPPVGNYPMYTKLTNEQVMVRVADRGSASALNARNAADLYAEFDKVVLLRQNMRAREDPDFSQILENGRVGKWTNDDYKCLQSRRFENISDHDVAALRTVISDGKFVPIITSSNERRKKLNVAYSISAAVAYKRAIAASATRTHAFSSSAEAASPVIRLIASLNSNKSQSRLTEDHQLLADLLSTPLLGRYSPFLDIWIGAKVMVTSNIATSNKISNGSVGTVVGCAFPENCTFTEVPISANSDVHCLIPSKMPHAIFVEMAEGLFR
jgi:hypothetical protein